jgi:hypothetical protein
MATERSTQTTPERERELWGRALIDAAGTGEPALLLYWRYRLAEAERLIAEGEVSDE